MGYQGQKIKALAKVFKKEIEVIKRPRQSWWIPNEITDVVQYLKKRGIEIIKDFQVLPRRWVVERTFAWMGRFRRMSKDYEYLTHTSEAFLYASMSRIMLKRIEKCLI